MLIGYYWDKLTRKELIGGVVCTFLLLMLLTVGLEALGSRKLLTKELHGYLSNLLPLLGILLIGLVVALILSLKAKRNQSVFYTLVITVALFWLALLSQFSPIVESYKPMKPMALELKQLRSVYPAPVIAYHVAGTASLIFYSDTPMANVDTPELFLLLWRKQKAYAFIDEKTLASLDESIKPYHLIAARRTLRLISNFNPELR